MGILNILKTYQPFQKIEKVKVDPVLKSRLEEKGQQDKIKSITQGLPSRASTIASAFRDTAANSPVLDLTGGRQIARGLAGAIIAPEVNRIQQQNLSAQQNLAKAIRDKARSGKLSDYDRQRYAKLMSQMSDVDVTKDIPELNITNKQIIGDAAQLALTATMGFKPGTSGLRVGGKLTPASTFKEIGAANKAIKAVSEAERVRKYGTAGKVANVAINRGKSAVINAVTGGGVFGASKLAEGGTTEEALKSAKTGAAVSVVAPLAFEGAARVVGKGGSLLYNKVAKPVAGATMNKLEKVAAGTPVAERLAKFSGTKLDDITTEARKYKSADEFVKAQTSTKAGVGFKDEFKGSGEFNQAVKELKQNTGEKIVRGTLDINKLKETQTTNDIQRLERVRAEIKSGVRNPIVVEHQAPNFYDVIDGNTRLAVYKELGIKDIPVVVNESGLPNSLTKSQLTDIWNKAQLLNTSDEASKVMASFKPPETLKQKVASKIVGGVKAVQSLPSKITDRYAALRPYQEAYQGARLAASAAEGKAEIARDSLFGKKGAYAKYNDILPEIEKRIAIEDFAARAADGQKVASGQDSKALAQALSEHKTAMGANEPRVQEGVKIWNKFKDDFLQEMVDAGVKSQDDINAMKAKYPTHFPHKVLFDEVDDLATKTLPNASLDVPHTGFNKAVGSSRELEELPFDALVGRLQKGYRIIENNKVLNELVKESPNIAGMRRLRNIGPGVIKKPGIGEEVISLFSKGKKQEWVVPKDIAVAVKNLDAERLPAVIRAVGRINNVMKKLSTTYNIPFIAQNKLRDEQTKFITADAFIQDMVRRTSAKPTAVNLDSDELYKLWKTSGGSFGSIYDDGASQISKLSRKGWGGTIASNLSPAAAIRKVNMAVEESTRLEVFKRGLQAGLDPKKAALVARDATVDFSKMGSTMRTLNEIVPFLNARVQGAMNIGKALKLAPEKFAQAQMFTSVYPTMALYSWNSKFDSYQSVPQYFKDGYWVIMTGEQEGVDDNGKVIMVPQFLTFRKGEAQQLTSSPIEWFLAKSEKKDPRRVGEMIKNTIGNVSPVDVGIGGYQNKNPLLGLISQLGPLGSIGVGLATNIDPYTGSKIVPESRIKASTENQFKKTTPQLTREIANMLGVAPARLEFMINSTGGTSKDIQLAADLAEGGIKGEGLRTNPVTDTGFGQAARLPFSKSFLRESTGFGSALQQGNQELKDIVETQATDKALLIKDEAEKIFTKINKLKTKEERIKYLEEANPSDEVRKKISQLKKSRQAVEVLTKQDPVEVRALYIHQRILQMKKDGVDVKDRTSFLDDLEKAKILTKDVKKRILELKQQ